MKETMAKTSPIQFFREVRQEVQKVTWPTRRETLISTGLVMVMVVLAALFFFVVDTLIAIAIRFIIDFNFGI
jgi:preprotein translocase subunit SecE